MIMFYSYYASNHWIVQTGELNVLHLPHFLWKQEKGGSTVSHFYLFWTRPQYTSWPINMAAIPGPLARHSLWVYPKHESLLVTKAQVYVHSLA